MYGPNSDQFYRKISGFIDYLIYRYHGRLDEDLKQSCFVKIYTSLNHFDPEKGGLGTFIFTAIRNEISRYNYRVDRRRREVEFDYSQDYFVEDDVDLVDENLDVFYFMENSIRKFSLSDGLKSRIMSDYSAGKTNIFIGFILW